MHFGYLFISNVLCCVYWMLLLRQLKHNTNCFPYFHVSLAAAPQHSWISFSCPWPQSELPIIDVVLRKRIKGPLRVSWMSQIWLETPHMYICVCMKARIVVLESAMNPSCTWIWCQMRHHLWICRRRLEFLHLMTDRFPLLMTRDTTGPATTGGYIYCTLALCGNVHHKVSVWKIIFIFFRK